MQSAPSGLLRISVATDFGVNHMSPILGEFLFEFPDITVNMVLKNRYVELISKGFDMAVRIVELEDSTLRARKLTDTTRRMIASPVYSLNDVMITSTRRLASRPSAVRLLAIGARYPIPSAASRLR